ncbi:NAD(P)H-binding protein [Leifsonia sp. NPDC080035]|uniref:NAD(P)H-binding protein n=1 Tax=Leifsonia sp. NPDC080035 TaxID=3143936 RepID=A0AAU7GDZ1_9MICO
MARITVLGGTGYTGAAIVAEAARRGHEVTAVSRSEPSEPVDGVEYVVGSVLDPAVLDRVVPERDAVISALSPRGDMAGELEGVIRELARRADGTPTRIAHVGGASSLLVAPDGPRLWDVTKDELPDTVKPEIETGMTILDDLKATPETVDWFYISPPEVYGAWAPAPATGRYRLGDDVLLRAEDGTSTISAADLAVAIVDEIERPAHHRRRFTAAH